MTNPHWCSTPVGIYAKQIPERLLIDLDWNSSKLEGKMYFLLIEKGSVIEDSFEQVFFMMVQLPYLQPFADVNKKVSRLAANIPLIRKTSVLRGCIQPNGNPGRTGSILK